MKSKLIKINYVPSHCSLLSSFVVVGYKKNKAMQESRTGT